MKPGLRAYVGAPGTGKTTLARKELLQICREQNFGALIVDSAHVEQLGDFVHAETLTEAIPQIYKQKRIIRWTPNNIEEFERACRALRIGGKCALLVDELKFWCPGARPKIPDELARLCRTWRHSQVSVLMTTQLLSTDLGSTLLGLDLELAIFRVTAPTSLDFVQRWIGRDLAETIRKQSVGECVRVRI